MKIKKSVAFVCACAMALSMVSVSAFAVDYGNGGGGTIAPIVNDNNNNSDSDEETSEEKPKVETVVDSKEIKEAIANGKPVLILGDSIVLGKAALSAIVNADAPVTFVNKDTGVQITIDPATIKKIGKIDLGMDIKENDMGVKITPAMTGEFGLTLTINIPKSNIPSSVDVNNAHLFYVDDKGKVEDLGAIAPNKDGSFTIDITHASSYIIASAAIEDISAGAGLDGTGDIIED